MTRVAHIRGQGTRALGQGTSTLGQGMVEFALALPVFLLLVFGVIEVGHLLMTYSAVYSAAREGARFGAAVGISGNGMAYDHDCDGMKAAAVRVGFLGGVKTDSVIVRMYDASGVLKKDSTGATIGDKWCTQSNANWTTSLSDRVEVEIAVNYAPIVPLVPIPALTVSGTTGGVRSVSARTLVQNVAQEGVFIPTATQQQFTLTIATIGNGTVTLSSPSSTITSAVGGYNFQVGTTVNLVALPATCNSFVKWTIDGADLATANTSVSMTKSIIATAYFAPTTYNLTVNSINVPYPGVPGGEVIIDGTSTTNGQFSGALNCGMHTLEPAPAPLYYFYNWSGAAIGAASPLFFNLNADATINASFTTPDQPRKLTVNLNIPNSGTITNDKPAFPVFPGSYLYLPTGTVVTLGAAPNTGFGFVNWTNELGAQIGTNPASLQVTVSGDVVVNANFGAALTTATSGCGTLACSANVTSPVQAFYSPGTNVTVTAIVGPGLDFINWTDSSGRVATSSSNPYTFSFPSGGPVTLTANYAKKPYTLTIAIAPVGGGSTQVSAGGPYYYGDSLTITPVPATGYQYDSWELNGLANATINSATHVLSISSIEGNISLGLNFEAYCAQASQLTTSIPSDSGATFSWNLGNTSGVPVHITQLSGVFWNGNKNLTKVTLNGATIWTGSVITGSTISISQNNVLPASSPTNSLIFHFDGNTNSASGSALQVGYSSAELCPP